MRELASETAPNPNRPAVGESELRTIVASIPDAVVVVGAHERIRFANPAAEALFGRTLVDLVGLDMGLPAVERGKTEMDVVRPGGKTVTAEVRFVEVEWNGENARIITLRDVTDRKRAEEKSRQLERERQARAEAEAASHAKSEFLTTMSHELRTPLNAIIGYSELLELGISGSLSEKQQAQVSRIANSGKHLLGLVNEILDLAKVEAGRLSVQSEAGRVMDVVEATLAIVAGRAESRGIDVRFNRCDPAVLFHGDSDRVRQVLVNLLNNAVKFTRPGGQVTIECAVVAQPDSGATVTGRGPWIRLSVSDTGIGIPAERISSIFDPFVQVESGHARSSDGSGLGLTISRRLARLMGGDLTVTSELGRGSTFSLWLDHAAAPGAQEPQSAWPASPVMATRLQGLSDVAIHVLRELPTLCDAFVDRLRAEAIIPNTESLRAAQLADHLVCYVADIATVLKAIEETRGAPSRLIDDSEEIHDFIATKHGAHRARLGSTTETLRQEWRIIGEEVERIIRRAAPSAPNAGVITEALRIARRYLDQGEQASIRGLLGALGPSLESGT